MNRLATDKRTAVIAALVEGTSINATSRITGVAKHTILKLLKDMGCACASFHDTHVRNVSVRRLQCDEIWSFVGAKMDTWIQVFAVLVAIGIMGEVGFGVRHWVLNRRLAILQHADDLNQEETIAGLKKDASSALERAAKAEENLGEAKRQAAEANRIAEQERLERIKIEERLASRRISKSRKEEIVKLLTPFAGARITLQKIGDAEAAEFANDLISVLKESQWTVDLSIMGMISPPRYGLQCTVDKSPAGQALANAIRELPTAAVMVDESINDPNTHAWCLVGLKPPT